MNGRKQLQQKDLIEFQIEGEFPKSLNGQGIYAIRNIMNGRMYIGSSKNIRSRIFQHLNALENKQTNHHSSFLQFAWNKYGKSNFSIIILEIVEKEEELITREQYWIDNFNSYEEGFNARPRAEANYGIKWSKKQNEARRKSNIISWSNPVLRRKLSTRFKGKRRGQWTKNSHKKASESLKDRHKENPGWREKIKKILSLPEIQRRRTEGVKKSLKNKGVYNKRVQQLKEASMAPKRILNLRKTYFNKFHRGKLGIETIQELELTIKELYKKGKSVHEIGQLLEIDNKTIKNYIKKLDITFEKRYRKGVNNHQAKLNVEDVKKIKLLIGEGISTL